MYRVYFLHYSRYSICTVCTFYTTVDTAYCVDVLSTLQLVYNYSSVIVPVVGPSLPTLILRKSQMSVCQKRLLPPKLHDGITILV